MSHTYQTEVYSYISDDTAKEVEILKVHKHVLCKCMDLDMREGGGSQNTTAERKLLTFSHKQTNFVPAWS